MVLLWQSKKKKVFKKIITIFRTAGATSGAKSPGNTTSGGLIGSAGVSMPSEAKTPPTLQNKQKGDHPSVSVAFSISKCSFSPSSPIIPTDYMGIGYKICSVANSNDFFFYSVEFLRYEKDQ